MLSALGACRFFYRRRSDSGRSPSDYEAAVMTLPTKEQRQKARQFIDDYFKSRISPLTGLRRYNEAKGLVRRLPKEQQDYWNKEADDQAARWHASLEKMGGNT
jgi:hypothetical protein